MSLDVYLTRKVEPQECECDCPKCGKTVPHKGSESETVFSANVTHNLGAMAASAGIYKCCWRPDEIGASRAGDIIFALKNGLADLRARPDHFKQYNPENGWGTYEGFVYWVEKYLDACIEYPEAEIRVSR